MSEIQKTHFADDDTLAYIAKLEAEIERLECELKLTYAAVEKLKSENEALRQNAEEHRQSVIAREEECQKALTENAAFKAQIGDLELEIEGEVKENMALRDDAERYRWLRLRPFDEVRDMFMLHGTEQQRDAAIDAARKP